MEVSIHQSFALCSQNEKQKQKKQKNPTKHSKYYHVEKMLKVLKALIMARLTCYILTESIREMGVLNV